MQNLTPVYRLFFVNITLLIMAGIWPTGYENAHWFMYASPVALLFAVASGYCTGIDISRKIPGFSS